MDAVQLSFEISFPALDPFVEYWATRYRDTDRDGRYYDPNLGKANLRTDEQALMALFTWKNGGDGISAKKKASISTNYFDRWVEDGELENRYLDPKQGGGPIWNIFYIHCRRPDLYPIYDQHAYRAMRYIQGQGGRRNLIEERRSFVYESYSKEYRPFVTMIGAATGRDLRSIDRALYTFGQFLKVAGPYMAGES